MSKRQIPRGPDDLMCPLHKAAMDTVCHKCPWWQQVRGKHPQSNEDLDRWDCAVALLPLLLIENSQRQMQTAASVDKVANEMKNTDTQSAAVIGTLTTMLNRVLDVPRPAQLPNGHGSNHLLLGQD